jgi:hypothetical protein
MEQFRVATKLNINYFTSSIMHNNNKDTCVQMIHEGIIFRKNQDA